MIVDAHHHFWQIDRGGYDWIDADLWELRRDFLPQHLEPYLAALGIEQTVLVQASETLRENEFLLDMAAASERVGAVVAWVDLSAKDARAQIDKLAAYPIVKGVRPVLQGIEDTLWLLQPSVLAALRYAATLGLRFDALVQPRHLPMLRRLVELVPDLWVVIDHAAKPVIGTGREAGQAWRQSMADLAQNAQVFSKFSGLATEFGSGWRAQDLQPIADHLLECFGPERLMWGSDWPVLERHASYSQWFAAAKSIIPPDDVAGVFGGAATDFYALTKEKPHVDRP